MTTGKIEPRLQAEIERARRTASCEAIPVVIVPPIQPGEAEPQPQGLRSRSLAELRGRIRALGITAPIRELPLAGALVLDLSPDEIVELGGDRSVGRIVWNPTERIR